MLIRRLLLERLHVTNISESIIPNILELLQRVYISVLPDVINLHKNDLIIFGKFNYSYTIDCTQFSPLYKGKLDREYKQVKDTVDILKKLERKISHLCEHYCEGLEIISTCTFLSKDNELTGIHLESSILLPENNTKIYV